MLMDDSKDGVKVAQMANEMADVKDIERDGRSDSAMVDEREEKLESMMVFLLVAHWGRY